jgi:thymidylate synthase (FAD)
MSCEYTKLDNSLVPKHITYNTECMPLNIISSPRITLLSRETFINPEHYEWNPKSYTSRDSELLSEFAGRLCYMSFGAGSVDGHQTVDGRTDSEAYIENIKRQKHGSVLEHGKFSFLVEGISRSLSHEWVRHRAGFSYSQLSQRFVNESNVAFVKPPLLDFDTPEYSRWVESCNDSLFDYNIIFEKLQGRGFSKKDAAGTARSVLPNATETKMVVSANARSWRHFLQKRGAEGAEIEIAIVAAQLANFLKAEAPNVFGDVYTWMKGKRPITEMQHENV